MRPKHNPASLTSAVSAGGASLATNSALLAAIDRVQRGETLNLAPPRRMPLPEYEAFARSVGELMDREADALIRKAASVPRVIDKMIRTLEKGSVATNRSRLRDPEASRHLHADLEQFVSTGMPMPLLLPLGGGKAPNAVKTGNGVLPDASEWIAFARLAALARALEAQHPSDVRAIVVPDAPLHTADMGFAAVDVARHLSALRVDLDQLGLSPFVSIEDPTPWLDSNWQKAVAGHSRAARRGFEGSKDELQSARDQAQSLRFTLNENALGLPYEDSVLVMGVVAGRLDNPPKRIAQLAEQHVQRTWGVLPHYIGVNHALRSQDVMAQAAKSVMGHREHVRLTVHAKPGEPRPALHQSATLARPALLPMHGVARRVQEKGVDRIVTIFDVEARVLGLRPVHDPNGRFLFYEDPVAQS